jgi:hypothetical protein
MCTVTLRCGAGSLLLTMNRDERYDRAPEEEPRQIPGEPGRPAWLAPFDSATGGTWIGVNERGVCSCILNGYEPEDEELRKDPAIPSRGSIVPRILEGQEGGGVARLPDALDFSAYPSFTMLVASKDGGEIVRWRRGSGLTREGISPGWTFLTSSSWREPDVALWRRWVFDAWRVAGEPEINGIPALHLNTGDGTAAGAVLMTREESATRSITQVRVDPASGTATLRWWPRHGTETIDPHRPSSSLTLPLSAAAGCLDEGPGA